MKFTNNVILLFEIIKNYLLGDICLLFHFSLFRDLIFLSWLDQLSSIEIKGNFLSELQVSY